LVYQYNENGDAITLGADLGSTDSMLYLNPVASITDEGRKVGFYISSSRVPVEIEEGTWQDLNAGINSSSSNFVINWTYDELIPANYVSETQFGVGWVNDTLYDGKQDTGADLYIRAIDLGTHQMLAIFKATIIFDPDTGCYALDSVQGNDVARTGELTMEDRTALLSDAYDLVSNETYGPNALAANHMASTDRDWAISNGFVEYLGKDRMYFNKCLTTVRRASLSSKQWKYYSDIFAVTIPEESGRFIESV